MERTTSASTSEARLQPILRWLYLGTLPGIATGIIIGGIGSRIVMRIVVAMEGSLPHQETDFGFTVGSITGFGMVFLIIFAGSASGIVGGLAYMCVRPWLGARLRWRGLYFGTVLLLAGGGLVIEGGNTDFVRFGSSNVNILMFAALFMLFGLLIAPLIEWADGRFHFASPQHDLHTSDRVLLGIGYMVVAVPLTLISLLVFTGLISDPIKIIIPVLLLALIPIAYMAKSGYEKRRSGMFLAGYGIIAAASILGLTFGLQAIAEIQDCAEALSNRGSQFTVITEELAKVICN